MKAARLLVKALRGTGSDTPKNLFKFQRAAFYSSYNLVRIFYAICLFFLVSRMDLWSRWLSVKYISPLWPVYWINLTDIKTGVMIIMILSLISVILCLLFSDKRIFRIIWFIAVLNYLGFKFSFGRINHNYHVILAFSFMFIFLPDGKKDFIEKKRVDMQRYLTVFWGALLLFMTFYSMSGMWKIIIGAVQLFRGEPGIFSLSAFALNVSNKMLQLNSEPLLGGFFVKHLFPGWLVLMLTVYIEFFSIVAIFRNSLHRIWGVFLIIFHIAVYLVMEINFTVNILFLAVFLCNSPFIPPNNKIGTALKNLPLVDIVFMVLNRRQFKKVLRHT